MSDTMALDDVVLYLTGWRTAGQIEEHFLQEHPEDYQLHIGQRLARRQWLIKQAGVPEGCTLELMPVDDGSSIWSLLLYAESARYRNQLLGHRIIFRDTHNAVIDWLHNFAWMEPNPL